GSVIGPGWIVAEGRVYETHRLVNRDGRELDTIGHIANCPDVPDIGARIVVDEDFTQLAYGNSCGFEPQLFRIRYATKRDHHLVVGNHLAALEARIETAVRAPLDCRENLVAKDTDTLLLHGFMQHSPEIHVETLEDFLAPVYQRRPGAEPMKDI